MNASAQNASAGDKAALFFFYLTTKIEAPSKTMTGAAIKALIKSHVPTFDVSHTLVLEGIGSAPDTMIADDATVDLSHGHGEPPKHFLSKPPTSFGDRPVWMSPALAEHVARLAERFPASAITPGMSGMALVHVPALPLPAGWSKTHTDVWFLVPAGYPAANPDCFWADHDLRLADGKVPQNSNPHQNVPGTAIFALWFSWHITSGWHPATSDLRTYLHSIAARFQHAS